MTFGRRRVFVYGGITLCAGPSQVLRLTTTLSDSLLVRQNQPNGPTTPDTQRLPAITRMWFGLFRFRSPLLTESRLLSLPVGTEMFHFPTFPPHALCVQAWVTGHDSCWVSPFGNPRITARLAAPRGFSQPPTSFFGSWCQGIHRVPLKTWHIRNHYKNTQRNPPPRKAGRLQVLDARVHCAVLKIRAVPAHAPPHPRWGGPVHERWQKPVPSGPNSVLGQAVAATTLPARRPY